VARLLRWESHVIVGELLHMNAEMVALLLKKMKRILPTLTRSSNMTDVETIILTQLKEIRESQVRAETVLAAHIADDTNQLGRLKTELAVAKGKVIGFTTAVGLGSGVAGAGASLLIKYFVGW
jgi:hypothetical protein